MNAIIHTLNVPILLQWTWFVAIFIYGSSYCLLQWRMEWLIVISTSFQWFTNLNTRPTLRLLSSTTPIRVFSLYCYENCVGVSINASVNFHRPCRYFSLLAPLQPSTSIRQSWVLLLVIITHLCPSYICHHSHRRFTGPAFLGHCERSLWCRMTERVSRSTPTWSLPELPW